MRAALKFLRQLGQGIRNISVSPVSQSTEIKHETFTSAIMKKLYGPTSPKSISIALKTATSDKMNTSES